MWLLLFFSLFSFCHADLKLNTTELVADYGLHCHVHRVTTRDGYILQIFRIPKPGGFPVVFMPGFLSSSNTWVVAPRNQSVVAALADAGYDVWLLNYRGSFFGKNHISLDPEKDAAKFWDFTFHEIGTLDIPAILDYIEEETGAREVLYVGHSMGCLSLYVMCVERPDYCSRIRAAGLLAPVIFPPSNVDRASISTAISLVKNFASTARKLGLHELFGNEEDRAKSIKRTCSIPIIGKTLCTFTLNIPFSGSTRNVDQESLPSYVTNTLSGTSIKLAEHMTQLMTSSRRVPKFNYGWAKNWKKYKSRYSPYYNGTVSAPLIVFHSSSDPFTDQKAINDLKKVSNVVYDKLITDKTFNHINFIFSNNARKYVIDDLVQLFGIAVNSNQ